MATTENLQAAFAGESQANRTYLAFAKKADLDGKPQVAKLFRAAAAAETIHAHAHLAVLGGVKTTEENLKEAIAGEDHEFNVMYPEFIEAATAEDNKKALKSFTNAMAVEKIHSDLYNEALKSVEAGNDLDAAAIYVCPVCGNTVVGAAPEKCPICNVPGAKFAEIK